MIALALALLAVSSNARPTPAEDKSTMSRGTLVLQDVGSALDATTCRALTSGDGTQQRLWLVLPGATDAVDPLSACAARVTRADIPDDDSHRGDDVELAERARAASEIVLSRGTYLGWRRFLGREGAPSRVGRALEEAQRQGKLVCAQGAAAAYLAQWTIVEHADIGREPRNARTAGGPLIVRGLGLLPDTLIDTSSRTGGALDPLLVSLARSSIVDAIQLDGAVSWIARDRDGHARSVGTGRAIVFDLSRARRMRGDLREARVASFGPARAPETSDRKDASIPAVLTAEELAATIQALCTGETTTVAISRGGLRVTLWIDEASDRDVRNGIGIDVLRLPE